jgi:hypothetical protein
MPNPTLRQWRNLVIMGVTMLVLGNGMVVLAERGVLGPGRHRGGLGAAVDGAASALRGQHASKGEWLGIATRLSWRGLAQRRQQPDRLADRAGAAADRADRLGLRFGVGTRPGPAGPFMTAAGQMLCGGVLC